MDGDDKTLYLDDRQCDTRKIISNSLAGRYSDQIGRMGGDDPPTHRQGRADYADHPYQQQHQPYPQPLPANDQSPNLDNDYLNPIPTPRDGFFRPENPHQQIESHHQLQQDHQHYLLGDNRTDHRCKGDITDDGLVADAGTNHQSLEQYVGFAMTELYPYGLGIAISRDTGMLIFKSKDGLTSDTVMKKKMKREQLERQASERE